MVNCKKCGSNFEPTKGLVNFCSLECRNSRTWSEEDKLKKSNSAKDSIKVKNANKIICSNNIKDRIIKKCVTCGCDMYLIPSSVRIYCSIECYKNSDTQKNAGGSRKGSGVGKSGWYKGYWCDSSWELAWVIYNLDHNILFERNKIPFHYEFNGSLLKYYPDFIIDNVYYEIKGYLTKQTIEKIKQFTGELIIIGRNEMRPFLEYVTTECGKNYIRLYEDNPYNILTKICPICNGPCKEKNKVCSRVCAGKLLKIK